MVAAWHFDLASHDEPSCQLVQLADCGVVMNWMKTFRIDCILPAFSVPVSECHSCSWYISSCQAVNSIDYCVSWWYRAVIKEIVFNFTTCRQATLESEFDSQLRTLWMKSWRQLSFFVVRRKCITVMYQWFNDIDTPEVYCISMYQWYWYWYCTKKCIMILDTIFVRMYYDTCIVDTPQHWGLGR